MTERSSFAACLRFFFWFGFLLYTQKKMNTRHPQRKWKDCILSKNNEQDKNKRYNKQTNVNKEKNDNKTNIQNQSLNNDRKNPFIFRRKTSKHQTQNRNYLTYCKIVINNNLFIHRHNKFNVDTTLYPHCKGTTYKKKQKIISGPKKTRICQFLTQ